MTGWNLGATGLGKADKVDFELLKTTKATNNSNANCYYQAWHDLGTPRQPIMVLNIIKNAEQSSSAEHSDALPSRPIMLSEPAVGFFQIWRDQIPYDFHENQLLFTAEPL